jgi:hypothetical protein
MTELTRFSRVGAGDVRDSNGVADVRVSQRMTLTATNTVANAAKFVVRGEFEIADIITVVQSALNASAKTINIGTDTSATRFVAQAISAGAANERFTATPASADVAAWRTTGSAQGVTTVAAYFTDVSGLSNSAYLTIDYYVRG